MKVSFIRGFSLLLIILPINAQEGWFWQNPYPMNAAYYGISFTDTNIGTAVGSNGAIIRTTDGGENWIIQSSGTTSALLDVCIVNAFYGIAVGLNGTVIRTTNSGTTWVSKSSGITNALFSVSFINKNIGTAVGSNGSIIGTTEGGENWISQYNGKIKKL